MSSRVPLVALQSVPMCPLLTRDEEAAVEGEPVPGERPEGEGEVPRINVEIPRCVAQLGSDLHFVKLPNFLSVETR